MMHDDFLNEQSDGEDDDEDWEIPCDDCGEGIGFIFMLVDRVWYDELHLANEFLCLACTEKRAGRPFGIHEFKLRVLCNQELIYGYLLCLRNLRHYGVI